MKMMLTWIFQQRSRVQQRSPRRPMETIDLTRPAPAHAPTDVTHFYARDPQFNILSFFSKTRKNEYDTSAKIMSAESTLGTHFFVLFVRSFSHLSVVFFDW